MVTEGNLATSFSTRGVSTGTNCEGAAGCCVPCTELVAEGGPLPEGCIVDEEQAPTEEVEEVVIVETTPSPAQQVTTTAMQTAAVDTKTTALQIVETTTVPLTITTPPPVIEKPCGNGQRHIAEEGEDCWTYAFGGLKAQVVGGKSLGKMTSCAPELLYKDRDGLFFHSGKYHQLEECDDFNSEDSDG